VWRSSRNFHEQPRDCFRSALSRHSIVPIPISITAVSNERPHIKPTDFCYTLERSHSLVNIHDLSPSLRSAHSTKRHITTPKMLYSLPLSTTLTYCSSCNQLRAVELFGKWETGQICRKINQQSKSGKALPQLQPTYAYILQDLEQWAQVSGEQQLSRVLRRPLTVEDYVQDSFYDYKERALLFDLEVLLACLEFST
jgi:hypothetical protein